MKKPDDTIPIKVLIEKIQNWRLQMVDDVNTNYAGRSYTDSVVAAAQIKSLTDDVQVLMQWVEILARKMDNHEQTP